MFQYNKKLSYTLTTNRSGSDCVKSQKEMRTKYRGTSKLGVLQMAHFRLEDVCNREGMKCNCYKIIKKNFERKGTGNKSY